MALPDNFSPFEHLQDTLRRIHNRRVREFFRDLADPNSDWEPEIDSPRGALRTACTMEDSDTGDMMNARMIVFQIVLEEARAMQTPVYGIPVTTFQEIRRFKPQVHLYFLEDYQDVEAGYSPVSGEISFRLMNETEQSLTEADLRTLGNKINTLFGSGSRFVWRKGKVMCSYTDRKKGYQLQLLCRNKEEGRRVIEQVLDIQSDSPNWKYMNVSENESVTERFPTIPATETILGRPRRMPRARPIADVRFQYALLHIYGLPNPIILVDHSGIFRDPIVA